MNRSTILLFGLGAQVILAVVFIVRAVGDIQVELQTQTESALVARNISWASVEINGRDATISGLAPNPKQRDRAIATLEAIDGIRRIRDELDLISAPEPPAEQPEVTVEALIEEMATRPPEIDLDLPYEFRVDREGSLTTISGFAPDGEARDSLIGMARQAFGSDRVIDRLETNSNAPRGFLFAATQALSMAELLNDGSVGVRDGEIYVKGLTANDRDLNRIREVIDTAIPEGYTSSVQLGSRQELEAVLRMNPDLAARIGPLPSTGTADVRRSEAEAPSAAQSPPAVPAPAARVIDRSPQAAERCQARFEALMASDKIAFATASSDIDDSSQVLLDNLVEVAKSCPGTRIEIAGHTDDQGRESNNLSLSQARAESVMAYMVRRGVDLGRLSAVGYGESQPLVPNRTYEDRAINRRIEFTFSQ